MKHFLKNAKILEDFLEEGSKTCNAFNPLSANPTKWSNTLKQSVGKSQQIVECV